MTDWPCDEAFQITDDVTAKSVLLQLSLLDKLGDPTGYGRNAAFSIVDDHPTHWLIAMRIIGNAIASENGYTILGWPKSKFSRSAAEEFIQHTLRKFGVGSMVEEKHDDPGFN